MALSFLLSKFNPLHKAPAPLERAAAGARLGSGRPGVQGDAESSRVPHTHPVLTTITTLGVGPLTSRCTMPNRWLYIFESLGMGAASAAVSQQWRPAGPASAMQRSGCHGAPCRVRGRWEGPKSVPSPW